MEASVPDPSELTLARQLNHVLRIKGLTIAVAEGSSGGRLGERLVRYAGASAYFKGAVVTYDYPSRAALLDIPVTVLQTHGSVSEPSVRAMAESVRAKFQANLGLASSGVTGPAGLGVGHLWLALATDTGTAAEEHWLAPSSRIALQRQFTELALRMLYNAVA
jgi:nicotinamide-nucleotide amidase